MTEEHDENEEAIESWVPFLESFSNDVYPTFKRFGFSKDAALIAYLINRLDNTICDPKDQDEEWKK